MNVNLQLLKNALGERGASEPKLSSGLFPTIDVTSILESELRAPGVLRGNAWDEWARCGRAFSATAFQAGVVGQLSHVQLSALPYAPGNAPPSSLVLLDEITASTDALGSIAFGMLGVVPFGLQQINQQGKRSGNKPPSAASLRTGTNAASQIAAAASFGSAFVLANSPWTVRFRPALIIEPVMTVPAAEVGFAVVHLVAQQNLRVTFQWREAPLSEQPG